MSPVRVIKLYRTDTTLDLSQKAEKGMTNQSLLAMIVVRCAVSPAATVWVLNPARNPGKASPSKSAKYFVSCT